MSSQKKLGRGLAALLDETPDIPMRVPASEPAVDGGVRTIAIELIDANPNQPRKYFDDEELEELADSVRARGVLQPILVRARRDDAGDERFEIVAGERRWRASQRAGVHEVPAVVREFSDDEALEIAIIENIQRADLNSMEEAYGYRQLIERYDYTQEQLAQNLGKSRSHIANMMRLMNLPATVQDMVRTEELSAGHARALVGHADPESLARRIVEKGLTVRDVEALIRSGEGSETEQRSAPAGKPARKDADTLLLEGDLTAILHMPVTIKNRGRQGGEVRIAYRNLDDLEELCRMLRGETEPVMASG